MSGALRIQMTQWQPQTGSGSKPVSLRQHVRVDVWLRPSETAAGDSSRYEARPDRDNGLARAAWTRRPCQPQNAGPQAVQVS